MKELTAAQVLLVSGGMSETAKVCLEGGAVGALGGAIVGGLLVAPLYTFVTNKNGISSPHQLFGFFLLGLGVTFGALAGSMIGSGTGFISSCQIHHDEPFLN